MKVHCEKSCRTFDFLLDYSIPDNRYIQQWLPNEYKIPGDVIFYQFDHSQNKYFPILFHESVLAVSVISQW